MSVPMAPDVSGAGSTNSSRYYGNVNRHLLDAMPLDAARICEFGCGSGALAAAYRDRNPRVHYTGIDLSDENLAGACALDQAVACDLNRVADWSLDARMVDALPPASFDAMVFGDVLEHLLDPDAVLRQAVQRLRPGGRVVASIPNVQFWGVLLQLVHGYWPRMDSGIFDRTHIRWFTLRNMRELFADAGLDLVSAKPCPGRESPERRQRRERTMDLIKPLVEAEGRDFATFVAQSSPLQYLLVGQKPASTVGASNDDARGSR